MSLTGGGDSEGWGGSSTGGAMRSVNEEEEDNDAEDLPLSDLATEALVSQHIHTKRERGEAFTL